MAWIDVLARPDSLWTLGVFAACVLLAWLITWSVGKAFVRQNLRILLGHKLYDGALFPVLLLILAFIARTLMVQQRASNLFDVLLPLCISLAVIRVSVKVLQGAFSDTALVAVLERTISWLAWGAVVLWVSGVLPLVMQELDDIYWKIGSSKFSILTLMEGALTAACVLVGTLWLSSIIETRLLQASTGGDLSMRKVVTHTVRIMLMFVGVLLALSSVGIDLTALSVLGGAIGVGIGFGLQKLAANYVSGFVILTERSLRIGDLVLVDGFEGRIVDIKARYTIIRALSGRDSIVPNEMLINQRIENLTLTNTKLSQAIKVTIDASADVEQVKRVLLAACLQHSRVVSDPAPQVFLSQIGLEGLEFILSYWLADPENGLLPLRSEIHLSLLAALREHQIPLALSKFPLRQTL